MKKIFLTLDYELFFGSRTGTLRNSIITPTEMFLDVCKKHNAKATFFVDAGYLTKLEEYKENYPALMEEYRMVSCQLHALHSGGHDIQLHIHPHWEDTRYDGEKWVMDTRRFKLSDFTDDEITHVVQKYVSVLKNYNPDINAFRAGGWCIQPFSRLKKVFINNKIFLDSTVYYGGYDLTATHYYDFRTAPDKSIWRFDDDPLIESDSGLFTELPISSARFLPFLYWKQALSKFIKLKRFRQLGDGSPIYASGEGILKKLLTCTRGVVSMDGMKAGYLDKVFRVFKRNDRGECFVIIGHPKALSPYSLAKLDRFMEKNKKESFISIYQFIKEVKK